MSNKTQNNTRKESRLNERRRNWRLQRGQTQLTKESAPGTSVPARRENWWGATISQFSRQKSLQHPVDSATTGGIIMRPNPSRRQSFLYRSGTPLDGINNLNLRSDGSAHLEREDRQFITPFAQILSILKKAHVLLSRYKTDETDSPTIYSPTNKTPVEGSPDNDQFRRSNTRLPSQQSLEDTIRDFDWCLEVLEGLQCKRSVSSLTRAKFCSMLSRELSTSLSDNTSGPKGADHEDQCADDLLEDATGEAEEAESVSVTSPDSGPVAEGAVGTGNKSSARHRPYLSRMRSNAGGLRHQHTHSSCSSQISDYIYQTFVEEDEDDEMVMKKTNDEEEGEEAERCGSSVCLNGSALDELDVVTELDQREPLRKSSETKDRTTTTNSTKNTLPELTRLWKERFDFNVDSVVQFIKKNEDSTSPDFFNFNQITNHHCLSTFGLYLLQKRGVLSKLGIPTMQMWLCLQRIETLYNRDTPYHNSIHAVDVLHTMHILFTYNQLDSMFSDLEIFATLFACVIHDVDHPGLTNQYLVNTNSELALLYNDSSVLENHHLFVAFNLLHNEPECDFSAQFSRTQRQLFRKMVISLVLSTDMSKHMSLLADLKTMVESQRASGSNVINLDTYSSRIQILESLVHASDLGNPTKPLPMYQQWVDRIMEEMFRQGDREREAGLEISPMCDRQNACVGTTQVSRSFLFKSNCCVYFQPGMKLFSHK
ncbi:Phosphodiesterase [Fasciolopsis buskii]|uniref:Phosphodiesterase n=1 Tax=Fasciolopsis buskii TaxID=27845 RepID=A0A8E0S415_9TREM|nr:Phosphodiesterase [Fasciolopsis buski]